MKTKEEVKSILNTCLFSDLLIAWEKYQDVKNENCENLSIWCNLRKPVDLDELANYIIAHPKDFKFILP